MKMTFRWYGEGRDPISLKKIKQIPGMSGLMGVLDEKAAGEVWTYEECKAYVDHIHEAGLECEVIESVNVHEDIKMGLPTRDQYIANYCETIRNLAKVGVKVIIYNFMPVFDWLRTDLAREIPEDGSNSLYFDEKELGEMTPVDLVKKTLDDCHGISLPGWEPGASGGPGAGSGHLQGHRSGQAPGELQVLPGRHHPHLRGSGREDGLPSRRSRLARVRPAPDHPQPGRL